MTNATESDQRKSGEDRAAGRSSVFREEMESATATYRDQRGPRADPSIGLHGFRRHLFECIQQTPIAYSIPSDKLYLTPSLGQFALG